jgi:hypothetical protein
MRKNSDVLAVILIALWLPAVLLFGSLAGCQAGHTGVFRPLSAETEKTITNAIATAASFAPVAIPPPWSAPIQAGAAAVLALLAAWQGLTHRKVTDLTCRLGGPAHPDLPPPPIRGSGQSTKIRITSPPQTP